MIVKCIATRPTEAQMQVLGSEFHLDRSFGVALGRKYLVLSLTVDAASLSAGGGAWVSVLMEPDIPTLISVPLCLFQIVDPRASRYWEIRVSGEGIVRLWPPSFYREYYHDGLSDRDPELVNDFWRVHALMDSESKDT